jgi:hypothetical protein
LPPFTRAGELEDGRRSRGLLSQFLCAQESGGENEKTAEHVIVSQANSKMAGVPEAYCPSSCAHRNRDGENQRATEYVIVSEAKGMTDEGTEIINSRPGKCTGVGGDQRTKKTCRCKRTEMAVTGKTSAMKPPLTHKRK